MALGALAWVVVVTSLCSVIVERSAKYAKTVGMVYIGLWILTHISPTAIDAAGWLLNA